MKRRTSRRFACKRDNSHFLRYVVISLEAQNPYTDPCALHNFDTLRHVLIIFGKNEEEDQ